MSPLNERLSEHFYCWELRGRGWQLWQQPVSLEPPFRPFYGHWVAPQPPIDDGRRPTFLSSLISKWSSKLADQQEPEPLIEYEEPELDVVERNELVELHASLPADAQISKEVCEQFILRLANCHEPIAFELIGTQESITAQLVAAEPDVDLVRDQLEAHFPEAVFTEQASFLAEKWNQADAEEAVIFEFGLAREFMFQLATARNFNIDPFIGIIAALSNLHENEVALFQAIFQPVSHPWDENILRSVTDESGKAFFVNQPELAGEAKEKIARPLFAAVVRIAIKSDGRMLDLAKNIAGALTVYSKPGGNEFIPLENSEYPFIEHEEDLLRRQSRRSGMILNSEELVSLVHLPSSSVRAPKLKRQAQRSKAAPKIVLNNEGLLLGINQYAGATNDVRLSAEQRVRHTYIIGTSGTGKSTLLFNLIRQDMENGQGLAVFDPHGDLIDKILGSIPEHRINDVVLIDPGDETHSVGFNILSAHSDLEKNLLASDLVSVFQRLSTSWGDQMTSVLNNAILAFLESSRGGTLADLQRFLIEPAFRNEFLTTVTDSQVLYYWKKAFPLLTGNKSIGPVLTRLGGFLDRKPVRYMVTQKQNQIDFAEIMNTGKIFLAKLSQGQIGNENAYLLGSFLVSKFQQLAMSRQAQAVATRKDFWCYCDEFHNFITPSMAQILTGARKYRLGLILAHQELRQLQRDSDVAGAVLSNPYTRICFRIGDDDARKLSDGFASFEARNLQNLGTGEAIARVERSDFDFNLTVPMPGEPDADQAAQRRLQVITASREKYGTPRTEIEAALREAVVPESEPTHQPKAPQAVPPAPIPSVGQTSKVSEAPNTTGSGKEEVVVQPSVVRESKPPRDLGKGGAQHQAIQRRIKEAAESLGFRSVIEKQLSESQESVDLLLERGDQRIACEISITTTIDHEVGNVAKCLKAGIPTIAIVCVDAERLRKIATAVSGSLGSEAALRVEYHQPDQFISHLKTLPPPALKDSVTTRQGYKVKCSTPKLTPQEQRQKEDVAIRLIGETMRRK